MAGLARRVRRWLPWVSVVLLCVAVVMVGRAIAEHGVDRIWRAVTSIEPGSLALASACTAASYATLTTFDLLGVRWAGSSLPYPKVALASFTALSIGHSVGLAALSSGTIRYRFYAQFGLREGDVLRIVLLCGVTVSLGLTTVAAAGALVANEEVARMIRLPAAQLRWIAIAALAVVGAYVLSPLVVKRPIRYRSMRLTWPPLRITAAQALVGSANFLLVASAAHALIGGVADLSLLAFASVYALGNTAGILSHVPGGIGVIEAVVLAAAPGAEVLGAMLTFRVLYYFVPLLIGGIVLAVAEWHGRRRRAAAGEG